MSFEIYRKSYTFRAIREKRGRVSYTKGWSSRVAFTCLFFPSFFFFLLIEGEWRVNTIEYFMRWVSNAATFRNNICVFLTFVHIHYMPFDTRSSPYYRYSGIVQCYFIVYFMYVMYLRTLVDNILCRIYYKKNILCTYNESLYCSMNNTAAYLSTNTSTGQLIVSYFSETTKSFFKMTIHQRNVDLACKFSKRMQFLCDRKLKKDSLARWSLNFNSSWRDTSREFVVVNYLSWVTNGSVFWSAVITRWGAMVVNIGEKYINNGWKKGSPCYEIWIFCKLNVCKWKQPKLEVVFGSFEIELWRLGVVRVECVLKIT